MNKLSLALAALRPDEEFTYNNDDLSTIVWHNSGVTTPTQEEIDAKIAEMDAEIEAKANARQSALSKLAALGLTADEIASL
jgi:hypothetical protein